MEHQSDKLEESSQDPGAAAQVSRGMGCLTIGLLIVCAPFILFFLSGAVLSLIGIPFAIMEWIQRSYFINSCILVGVALASHFAARFAYVKVIDYMMLRSGTSNDVHTLQSVDEPPAVFPPPKFQSFGESLIDLTDRPQEFAAVSLLNNGSSGLFNQGVYLALLLSFTISIGYAFWRTINHSAEPLTNMIQHAGFLGYPFIIASMLAFVNAKWTGEISLLNAYMLGIIGNIWIILISFGDAKLEESSFLQGLNTAALLIGYAVMVTAFAIAARVRSRHLKKLAGISTVRLLILRVFGIDKNVQAIFRAVGRRWLNIGPLTTIVDGSSANFDFKRYQSRLLILSIPLLSLLLIVTPGSITQPGLVAFLILFSVATYIFLLIVFFIYRVHRVRSDFSHNTAGLKHRIADHQTRSVSRKYAQSRMYCFSNTWRQALEELVGWTNVVLMDLRGIGEHNQGCAYEIAYLFNNFDLARTIFLVDEQTDHAFVESLMLEIWQRGLAAESPNARTEDLAINLYFAKHSSDLALDLEPLMSLFAEIVTQKPVVETESFEAERQSIGRSSALVWTGWSMAAIGVVTQFIYQQDGMLITSGFSIVWFSAGWLMLAWRIRSVLVAHGSGKQLFASTTWNLAFLIIAGGWIYWYLALPSMN